MSRGVGVGVEKCRGGDLGPYKRITLCLKMLCFIYFIILGLNYLLKDTLKNTTEDVSSEKLYQGSLKSVNYEYRGNLPLKKQPLF